MRELEELTGMRHRAVLDGEEADAIDAIERQLEQLSLAARLESALSALELPARLQVARARLKSLRLKRQETNEKLTACVQRLRAAIVGGTGLKPTTEDLHRLEREVSEIDASIKTAAADVESEAQKFAPRFAEKFLPYRREAGAALLAIARELRDIDRGLLELRSASDRLGADFPVARLSIDIEGLAAVAERMVR